MTQQEINQHSGEQGRIIPADTTDTQTNTGGYFDFKIYGLTQSGQSVLVVIPLHASIPEQATYRIYTAIDGWKDFIEDARNMLSSAPGEVGFCPPPGDPGFSPGLSSQNYCLQILIEDGGPNDADGRKNGVVVDPAGVAIIPAIGVVGQNNISGGGGGGCSLAINAVNPLERSDWWLLMVILTVLGITRRKCSN